MKIKLPKFFTLNHYYLSLTSALVAVALLLNRNAHQIFNQDMLHPASFLVDYRNGVTLSTWHWSPNNYFFPELAFYGLMNVLFRWLSPIQIQISYMIFGSFIFVLSIYVVSSRIFSFRLKSSNSLLAFAGIIAATVYPNYLFSNLGSIYFLLPWIHSGSYVGCLFALAIIIDCHTDASSHSKLKKGILSLLVFLLCASDYFFAIWFVIPIFLTLFHQQRINDISRRFFIQFTFLIVGSGFFGYLVHKLTNPSSRKIDLEDTLLSLERFADTLFQHTGILVFVGLWAIISILKFSTYSKPFAQTDGEAVHSYHRYSYHRIFWLWNFYSLIVTFFLINLYGLFYNQVSFRYFQQLLYNPVIVFVWLALNAVKFLENRFGETLIQELLKSFFGVSLIISFLSLPYIYNSYENARQYELYQCLKDDDVGILYSSYWNSKAVYVFSEGEIIPRQIADNGTPYYLSNNGAWYTLQPSQPYSIAIMEDTSFGRKVFPRYESKTCNRFDYKVIPSSMERRLVRLLPKPRQ